MRVWHLLGFLRQPRALFSPGDAVRILFKVVYEIAPVVHICGKHLHPAAGSRNQKTLALFKVRFSRSIQFLKND